MGSANYISLFDAKSGYWQISVAEEDQWKTAFVTHDENAIRVKKRMGYFCQGDENDFAPGSCFCRYVCR